MKKNTQTGMSLLEITVVLLVLIALAGLTMPYVAGTSRKALCDATDLSMMNIKKVIMEKYYLDTLGYFPVSKSGTPLAPGTDFSLHYLFDKSGWNTFDPDSQIGWRGPYLQGGIKLSTTPTGYMYQASNLANHFKNLNYVNKVFANNDYIVLDSWGRPFVLQVVNKTSCASAWGITTSEKYCARLVSAGSGSGPGILNADIETPLNGHRPTDSDDRILYLNVPTPPQDINISCEKY